MLGEPEDIEDHCNARLYIGDDHGDGCETMRCRLEPNHIGKHREAWRNGKATVEWEGDDRICRRCDYLVKDKSCLCYGRLSGYKSDDKGQCVECDHGIKCHHKEIPVEVKSDAPVDAHIKDIFSFFET